MNNPISTLSPWEAFRFVRTSSLAFWCIPLLAHSRSNQCCSNLPFRHGIILVIITPIPVQVPSHSMCPLTQARKPQENRATWLKYLKNQISIMLARSMWCALLSDKQRIRDSLFSRKLCIHHRISFSNTSDTIWISEWKQSSFSEIDSVASKWYSQFQWYIILFIA